MAWLRWVEQQDNEALISLLKGNATTVTNRLLAAVALGQLNKDGLNELSQQVLGSDLDQHHLLAAKLLSQHTGDTTLAQLQTIFKDGSNVAQFTAAQSLVANFPKVAREYAAQMGGPRRQQHASTRADVARSAVR